MLSISDVTSELFEPIVLFLLTLSVIFFGTCYVSKNLKRKYYRSTRPEVFLGKDIQKIDSKFTGEHPCQSVISIKLLSNFIEIALRHACSPVILLYIFRTPFPKNTSGWLLLILPNNKTRSNPKFLKFMNH